MRSSIGLFVSGVILVLGAHHLVSAYDSQDYRPVMLQKQALIVRGDVTAVTAKAITLASKDKAGATTSVSIPLADTTFYETVEKIFGADVRKQAAFADLANGQQVVVVRSALAGNPADKVQIHVLPLSPFQGTITDITRDPDAPTGHITLDDGAGTKKKFTVFEPTRFEVLRGTEVHWGSFLREHVGEKARIFPAAQARPNDAGKVQILLPPPPPPGKSLPPGKPYVHPVTGTVVDIDPVKSTITIQPHLTVAPTIGIVKDVAFDPNKEIGTMTLKVDGKDEKYTVNIWTHFVKVKGKQETGTNFLAEYKGEHVVVYHWPGHNSVAARVDIILSGKDHANDRYNDRLYYKITYQLSPGPKIAASEPATSYDYLRQHKRTPATLKDVVVGERITMLATGIHSHIAKHISIHLPDPLHGKVDSVTSTKLTLRLPAGKDKSSKTVDVALMPTTVYESVEKMFSGNVHQPATFAALKKDAHVTVLRGAAPPKPAQKVEIDVPPPPPIDGVITDISRSSDAPTGAITIDVKGKSMTFTVYEPTVFQILRGDVPHGSSFLHEHKGEKARIFPLAQSKPLDAAKVQILMPPYVPGKSQSHIYPVSGTVTAVSPTSITIQPHDPVPPTIGIVKSVSIDPNKEVGTMVLAVDGKDEKYGVNIYTHFVKVNASSQKSTNYLAEYKGETVVVYHWPGHSTVAARVDIVTGGTAHANTHYQNRLYHQITYQLSPSAKIPAGTPATTFDTVRSGKHKSATLKDVVVGERISMLATGYHSHIAKHISVHLPNPISGHVHSVSAGTLTLQLPKGTTNKSADKNGQLNVPLMPGTVFETVKDKVTQKSSLAAVKKGERVIVYPAGPPPHAAEKVEIGLAPPKAVTFSGHLVNVGAGQIIVNVKHPAKDGKAAFVAPEKFQLTGATQILLAKDKQPTKLSNANLGDDVTIHAHSDLGVVGPAEKIDLRPVLPKAFTFSGTIGAVGKGQITVTPKDGKAMSFNTGPTTQIVFSGDKKINTMLPGDNVTVHAQKRFDAIVAVDKVDVRPIVPTAVTLTGTLISAANGKIAVNVKNPPKDATNPMTFQLNAATQGATAKMSPGDDVTVHAHSRLGVIGPVEKIDVRPKTKKKKGTK